MEYKKQKTCMFTGHRDVMRIEPEHMSRLAPEMIKLIDLGVDTFLCGGAIGWDTYTAMTVIAMKASRPELKLVLVLPCCKADQIRFWGRTHIEFYDEIIKCADDIIYVSERYYDGCYQDRNVKMIEMSSYCICYLKRMRSGTGQTVCMAEKDGLSIINLADGGFEHV
ncbi:MAG: SLOG family protein [Ruminococcus sp.]|jgi:uncharacterized phage-like protein YoqJ|nr:SLOG family protein [Ruminococcus sp.]